MTKRKFILTIFIALLQFVGLQAQVETPVASIEIPAQNLLKFNRFLINPTFSTVNEDQSYLNFYHRNQWVKFDDNYQTYLASYSGRIGDRTGLGLSVYHQKFATISNFGLIANYAYGVRLSEKAKMTFGFNLSYYDSGVDPDGLSTTQPNDPLLQELNGSSLMTFQPGFNLSMGSFDVGLYAEDLFDYNLKESKSLTGFGEKTFTAHLMYTKRFENASGLMDGGKMSVLTRARRPGDQDLNLSGSLLFDLPKIGWIQTGYDDFYGLAGGIGFHLTKRLSLGYTLEKGLDDQVSNFGVTHEVNFAYSFQPNLTANRVLKDLEEDEKLVDLQPQVQPMDSILDREAEIAELKKRIAENDMIIEEMMFRQDSIEEARNREIDRKFAYLLKFIKDNNLPEQQLEVRKEVAQAIQAMKEGRDYELPTYNTDRSKSSVAQTKQEIAKQEVAKQEVAKQEVAKQEVAKQKLPEQTALPQEVAQEQKSKVQPVQEAQTTEIAAAQPKSVKSASDKAESYPYKKARLSFTATEKIKGVSPGYYAIVNVFSKPHYRDAFLKKLKGQGIAAGSFEKGGLHYVYLNRYEDSEAVQQAYAQNFDGTYDGRAWVLKVTVPYEEGAYAQQLPAQEAPKSASQKFSSKAEAMITTAGLQSGMSSCQDAYVAKLMKQFEPQRTNRKFNDPESREGYYLVAQVFSKDANALRYVDSLKQKGVDARIYVNPINNYHYVYLKKYKTWKQAMASYRNERNDTHKTDIWIMPVGSS